MAKTWFEGTCTFVIFNVTKSPFVFSQIAVAFAILIITDVNDDILVGGLVTSNALSISTLL